MATSGDENISNNVDIDVNNEVIRFTPNQLPKSRVGTRSDPQVIRIDPSLDSLGINTPIKISSTKPITIPSSDNGMAATKGDDVKLSEEVSVSTIVPLLEHAAEATGDADVKPFVRDAETVTIPTSDEATETTMPGLPSVT